MYKYLVFLSSFFLVVAKECNDKKSDKDAKCETTGMVKDFTGLDGCNFMILLDSGEKLQPVKFPTDDVQLIDGQKIKFGYKEVTNQMSICMAGKMVEITCVEFLESPTGGNKPAKIPCVETLDPSSSPWLKAALDRTNAYQVVRYKYLADGFAYYFQGPKTNLLLDCQGTMLCEAPARQSEKCEAKIKNLEDELIIWEIE